MFRWVETCTISIRHGQVHVQFCERPGAKLPGRTLQTPFKHPRILNRVHLYPLLKRLGIPKSGMHAFRHGRVSYLVECNTPIETTRAWIGHGSDEMVKLYRHLRPEYRKRILSTIPTLIHPELHPVHQKSETMFVEQVA
jgi:integrase